MDAYEKLNQFYLGKLFDPESSAPTDDLLLYSARDLTTHGVCVGMTGSGKTGLCVSLLEEAAIDGIPVIAIDPKGDLGNLALNFPRLRGEDFAPWVDPGEANRKGMTVDEYADDRATLWRNGLASWGQRPDRIKRLRDAADVSIYTPGSSTGLQLKVLRSLAAPPDEILADPDALRERTQAYVSGLLALLGVNADPVKSREHILLSNLIERAWRDGRDLDLPRLIHEIQEPPFDRLGVFELDSFYPAKDRFDLALALNNLLASPTFAAWIEGEPLDIQRLMFTPEGKNRISILSIAHLSDAERMFFVTLLLNEVVAWTRTQPGTGSLRAIIYMDEVFGYLPPTANPPSKQPLLTLLKQARAFGVGVLLATQNPVDLDYKALSNAGTWFIGRLQTERDRKRLLDGLQSTDSQFDRKQLVNLIKALDSRVFLMNNVHDSGPVLMHTRWALSYLRGPLTRTQIADLMGTKRKAQQKRIAATTPKPRRARKTAPRPVLPPEIDQRFVPVSLSGPDGATLSYQPALLATARLHYERRSASVDEYRSVGFWSHLVGKAIDDPWGSATEFAPSTLDLDDEPDSEASFASLPSEAAKARAYKGWQRDLVDHLYRTQDGIVFRCKELKSYGKLNEPEADVRAGLRHLLHEERDRDLEKLQQRFAPKVARLEERIRKAEQRVEKEKSQATQQGLSTVMSFGSSLLGALFGGRRTKLSTAARQAGRTMEQRGDVSRARETVEALKEQLDELNADLQMRLEETRDEADIELLELDEIRIRPKKSTMEVEVFALVWLPHWVAKDGMSTPAFELE